MNVTRIVHSDRGTSNRIFFMTKNSIMSFILQMDFSDKKIVMKERRDIKIQSITLIDMFYIAFGG